MKPNLLQSILPFLLSSRSHLGQRAQPLWSKKGIDPSSVFSVLGKREKLFLTNPLVTLNGLLKSLRAVQTVCNYNGSILIINTNPSLSLLCERFSFFSSLNKVGTNSFNLSCANLNQTADSLKKRDENILFFNGKIFFCNEKWTGGLLSNWKKVSNSVETFDNFSKAFGPFLRENKIQFSTYKEMKKRYNGLLEFQLRKLKEESLFLGADANQFQSKYLVNGSHVPQATTLGKEKDSLYKKDFNECATTTTCCAFGKSRKAIKKASRKLISKFISQPISEKRNFPTRIGTGKFNEKPDLIFLINCNENAHVLQEAASLKIPVIGITNTSTHQTGITYPIPGNSESAEFVFFCLKWVSAISTAPSHFSL